MIRKKKNMKKITKICGPVPYIIVAFSSFYRYKLSNQIYMIIIFTVVAIINVFIISHFFVKKIKILLIEPFFYVSNI